MLLVSAKGLSRVFVENLVVVDTIEEAVLDPPDVSIVIALTYLDGYKAEINADA